jgi:hypothetical protein
VELLASSVNVCPGEQVNLTCQTNSSDTEILRWSINLPSGVTIRKSIPIEGNLPPEPFIHPTTHGTVVFNFSRTSDESTYPLVIELLISGANIGINGTEISCSKVDLSDIRTITITIIDGRHHAKIYRPEFTYTMTTY